MNKNDKSTNKIKMLTEMKIKTENIIKVHSNYTKQNTNKTKVTLI